MGLIESFSVMVLLKNIPDAEDGILLNKGGVLLQAANSTAVKAMYDVRCATMYNVRRAMYDVMQYRMYDVII
ncbi:MAG: hypothetical protein ABI863_01395 [Ginsengibacter sp.]